MSSYFYKDEAAPEPTEPRRVTVVAIIEHQGSVLFDLRADAPYWGLIGGHVENYESLADALRREIHEETGLAVERFTLFGTFSDPSRRVRYASGEVYPLITVAYRVEVKDVSQLRRSDESRELRFFPIGSFPQNVIATQTPVIERYQSGAEGPFLD